MDNILTKRVYSKSKYIYRIYMERIEINVIEGQKWKGMLWLAHYNPEIDYRIEELKIIRFSQKCRRYGRPKQEKLGWQKQKKEEKKKEESKMWEEKEKAKKKAVKFNKKAKKLVSLNFHK